MQSSFLGFDDRLQLLETGEAGSARPLSLDVRDGGLLDGFAGGMFGEDEVTR